MIKCNNQTYFHIGYHRTGSTFLQKKVLPQFHDNAFLFLPHENNKIGSALIEEPNYKQEITTCLGELQSDFESSEGSGKPIVVSGEGLSGDMFHDYLDMPEKIYALFPNAKIVVMIRSQLSIIPSMYEYVYLKAGGTMSYSKFLAKTIENDKFNYYKLLSKYIDVFGRDAVKIKLYEDLKQDQKGFFDDILNFMELSSNYHIESSSSYRNTRYGALSILGVRLTNILMNPFVSPENDTVFHPFGIAVSEKLDSIFQKLPLRKLTGNEDKIKFQQKIIDYYRDSNRKLLEDLGLEIKQYNYPC